MKNKNGRKILSVLMTLCMALSIIPTQNLVSTYAADVTSSKIDVWDFGAEQLDTALYNNNLTPDVMNSWFSTLATVPAAGTSGTLLPITATLGTGDLTISTGGKAHRLRVTNSAVTRYDSKQLSNVDGTTIYNGYFYSNSGTTAGATPIVYLNLNVQKDDIVTLVVASNGLNSTINFEAPSGKKTTQLYTYAKNTAGTLQVGQTMTFYAGETGTYRISSADEKLCVARIYREHVSAATLSGTVTAPAALANYSVLLTNHQTGEEITAPVTAGAYSATVSEKYTYDISLKDAAGYIVSTEKSVSIPTDATSVTQNIGVVAVDLKTVSGTVTGLSAADLAKVAITFVKPADKIYVPVVAMDKTTGAYTAQVESGVDYTVTAANVNDSICSISSFNSSADSTMPIVFTAKPKYDVALTFEGLSADTALTAVTTFTNLNENGYSYTFTGTSGITLRNGTYSVSVATGTQYVQKLTSNLVVNGASVSKTIGFEKATTWDFSNASFTAAACTANKYNGLALTGVTKNGIYALINTAGSVLVPVSGNCKITVSYCYAAAGTINAATAFTTASGSTTKIETVTYNYVGAAGTVPITLTGKTYISKIVVDENQVTYKSDITVGATGCDYTTINAALTAIKSMDRVDAVTSEIKRVTVSIQPGNYEEMLVVDLPNVTFKNASSTPSIDLTNKGVSISDQAVRITSYYGHGYYYYSMGTDCKYNSDILAVNKANGYQSFNNPGSGTTNGSYWNATVVISGSGFEADGIIFENSYNQYISQKEASDTVVAGVGNKGVRSTTVGDTSVQNKSFVERAACLSIMNDTTKVEFSNCRFVGRQDSLYGGTGVTAAFNQCNIMGATDYIFGGMTAVFYKCDLTMNTSEDKNDVAYLTAAQQTTGRGYLMYKCNVKSTTPGVDTASTLTAKPGFFGRPWQATTSEVVFYKTTVEATTTYLDATTGVVSTNPTPQSLITAAGWNNSLGGASDKVYEYATTELAGVDNLSQRVTWAKQPTIAAIDSDKTAITIAAFLGDSWTTELKNEGKLLEDARADYTALDQMITSATSLVSSNYVDFANVTTALGSVVRFLEAAHQANVNAMGTTIKTAVDSLVLKDADYTGLNKAITDAQAIAGTTYTTTSYAALTKAISDAQTVVSAVYKIDNQSKIDEAKGAIDTAVTGLVKLSANYAALSTAITSAEALSSATYTAESYAALNTAVIGAKAVPVGLNIDSQGTIDSAVATITSAVNALVKKDADYSALTAAITSADALTSTNYVSGYSAVSTALTAAKAVQTGLKIDNQATINTALATLNTAVTALVLKEANYTALTAAITAAEAFTSSIYSTESYAALTTALTAAKAVPTGLKIDNQSTIDAKVTALNAAVASLVRVVIPASDTSNAKVLDDNAVIPAAAKLTVEAVVSGTNYDKAAAIVKAAETATDTTSAVVMNQFVVFEIDLKTSANVAITQLDGKVSVSIPMPAGFDLTKTITVFRVESNGALTKLDTKIVDGKCVFITDHFSTYVVAEVNEAVAAPEVVVTPEAVVTPEVTTTTAAPIVATGDASPIALYALVLGMSACTFMYATRKKRIRKAN